MKSKWRGWNEGVLSEDLVGFGFTHKKGSLVRFKRIKNPTHVGYTRLTEYSWHYLDENNDNLIRTSERIIEGFPYIKEKYL